MRNEREEKVETHQRGGRGEESAIKRIKCSLCSQETYGAAANSKSDAESTEVCIAKKKGSEEYSRFLGDCPRFEVMRTQTENKILLVSLVDHLLYITLRINTCRCKRTHRLRNATDLLYHKWQQS